MTLICNVSRPVPLYSENFSRNIEDMRGIGRHKIHIIKYTDNTVIADNENDL